MNFADWKNTIRQQSLNGDSDGPELSQYLNNFGAMFLLTLIGYYTEPAW